uniref:Aspartate aminotransferase n=1 Tax=Kappaphycus alvarezii TaxID=38544 RepID=A0A097IUW6_9FLOR|nr:aspartate aminotransferase [Kappaphycus alvarezii]
MHDSNPTPSIFNTVPVAPPDAILGLNTQYRSDPSPNKVNLGVGAYRTAEGQPYVLPVVRRVEQALANDPTTTHEYLPQDGLKQFCDLSANLILGPDSPALVDNRSVTVQALSGTGALRVGFTFVARFLSSETAVYIPKPSWSNHKNVVVQSGLPPTREYRYFDYGTGAVDMEGMIEDLKAAPAGSMVLLHGCAHNPTGADPTHEQWEQVLKVVQEGKLVPFFDNAYQGFASGSLQMDAWSVRRFVKAGLDMMVGQSYAKNMGLYGERVGALTVISSEGGNNEGIRSQLKAIIRAMYSNPPKHGAMVAARILGDTEMFAEWMREKLRGALVRIGTPGNWDHIVNQIGMFSFTGLTAAQVEFMKDKYHIYMTSNGRISMAGLTDDTVEYVAEAMKDAVVSLKKGVIHNM